MVQAQTAVADSPATIDLSRYTRQPWLGHAKVEPCKCCPCISCQHCDTHWFYQCKKRSKARIKVGPHEGHCEDFVPYLW